MQINVIYDQNASSLPTGFQAAVNYVVNYFDTTFTNPVTVNIDLGYGEIAGQSLGSGALGESETYFDSVGYSQAVNGLKANQPSATQQSAYSTLPGSSPLGGGTLWVSTAEEKALGLLASNNSAIDGYVGFSSTYPFSYSANATPASGQYYFDGVLAHEFSEVLGRDSMLGQGLGGTNSYTIMDLFRYSAPGSRQLGTGGPAYFSINNGGSNLDSWNTNLNGDLGDWAGSAGADSFLAFSPSGQIDSVTPTDVTLMNVLGWDTTPPIPPPVVTPTDQTVLQNQSVALSSMFAVSGSGITQYQVWFSWPEGGVPADGTVTVNGKAIALDQWVTVASLSSVVYTGSTTPGKDVIWVQAYNGSWSNAPRVNITDPGIAAPVVTSTDQTVAYNQSVPLSTMFSVSGSGITQYQVWFSWPEGGMPADGTVTVNGKAIALDQWVTVASLGSVVYTGSASLGKDVIWVQAYDGSWSNVSRANITDPGIAPPVVTSTDQTVAYNQSVALSTMFSVSGSGITQYQVWFSWPEGGMPADGTVTVNGKAIALDQWVTVASLSSVVYTGSASPGKDVIWVQAYDGSWSNVSRANITDPGIAPPVVTSTDQTVAYNQSVALSSMYSVSGSGITQYQVWFSWPEGGSPAHGTVKAGGATLAPDQWVTVSDLSSVVYTASSTPGKDVIWVQAYDGSWSNTSRVNITDPGNGGIAGAAAPVMTPTDQTVGYNQSVALSNMFAVSGIGITQYQVWFSWPEGGSPAHGTVTANGQAIAPDQWVTVSNLSSVVYTGSATPGQDVIWVQAYNGSWSNAPRVNITDGPITSTTIAAGATWELASAYSGAVSFAGATGTLKIDQSASFTGKIGGQLARGDVIDFADVTAGASATIGYTGSNAPGTLTISDGTHTASSALLGNYSLANFTASSDGHGGTSVVDPPLVAGQGGSATSGALASDAVASMALFNQHMASAFPTSGLTGGGTSAVDPFGTGLLPGLTQLVANPPQHT